MKPPFLSTKLLNKKGQNFHFVLFYLFIIDYLSIALFVISPKASILLSLKKGQF